MTSGLHELGHHVEADGHGGRREPLLHPLGEQHELLAHLPGQAPGDLPATAVVLKTIRPTPDRIVSRGFVRVPSFDAFFVVARGVM